MGRFGGPDAKFASSNNLDMGTIVEDQRPSFTAESFHVLAGRGSSSPAGRADPGYWTRKIFAQIPGRLANSGGARANIRQIKLSIPAGRNLAELGAIWRNLTVTRNPARRPHSRAHPQDDVS